MSAKDAGEGAQAHLGSKQCRRAWRACGGRRSGGSWHPVAALRWSPSRPPSTLAPAATPSHSGAPDLCQPWSKHALVPAMIYACMGMGMQDAAVCHALQRQPRLHSVGAAGWNLSQHARQSSTPACVHSNTQCENDHLQWAASPGQSWCWQS